MSIKCDYRLKVDSTVKLFQISEKFQVETALLKKFSSSHRSMIFEGDGVVLPYSFQSCYCCRCLCCPGDDLGFRIFIADDNPPGHFNKIDNAKDNAA